MKRYAGRGSSSSKLLIGVAVVALAAAVAVSGVVRSRQARNESVAAAGLQAINAAQNVYVMTHDEFATLQQLVDDGLLDDAFRSTPAGYEYSVTLQGDRDYLAAAEAPGGRYDFYSTSDYVVRFSTDPERAPAGRAGQPVR